LINDLAAQQRLCKASPRNGIDRNYSMYQHFANSLLSPATAFGSYIHSQEMKILFVGDSLTCG
jgi:hypothetical protein